MKSLTRPSFVPHATLLPLSFPTMQVGLVEVDVSSALDRACELEIVFTTARFALSYRYTRDSPARINMVEPGAFE